jgi:hypothetical protein
MKSEFIPRIPTKSKQKRMGKRAPHGSPDYPARIGAWVTEEQYQFFHEKGGSIWLRDILNKEMKK